MRAVRDDVQDIGDGYRRGDQDGGMVDTIRLTVKPPSLAIRWVSARFGRCACADEDSRVGCCSRWGSWKVGMRGSEQRVTT